VKDTGIGIEKEKVGHIFERFVKLNSFVLVPEIEF